MATRAEDEERRFAMVDTDACRMPGPVNLPAFDIETDALIEAQAREIDQLRQLVQHLSAGAAGLHAEIDAMRLETALRENPLDDQINPDESQLLDDIYACVFDRMDPSEIRVDDTTGKIRNRTG